MRMDPRSTAARWSMVVIALVVTASAFCFVNAVAFLIPALHARRGTPLAEAGLLAAMPSVGMVVTLIGWGFVADRLGERFVLTAGSALTAVAAFAAASVDSLVMMGVCLFLGGMAAAGCNPASGRLIAGWFPPHQRGLAMGVRQTAQPLGVAMGALTIPRLAAPDPALGLLFPASACAVAAVVGAVAAHDPPRRPHAQAPKPQLANPYRGNAVLWRVHALSALLAIPQSVTVTFTLVWLVDDHRWAQDAAGVLVAVTQLLGAGSRIAAGRWSDRIGSRMRPIRVVALATSATMLLLAVTNDLLPPLAVALMVAVSIITVMDNALEATAITEFAGQYWSGRALGMQNTTQRLMTLAGPPMFGTVVAAAGYPLAFALCGLLALAAVPLVPIGLVPPGLADRNERRSRRRRGRNSVRRRD